LKTKIHKSNLGPTDHLKVKKFHEASSFTLAAAKMVLAGAGRIPAKAKGN